MHRICIGEATLVSYNVLAPVELEHNEMCRYVLSQVPNMHIV